MHSDSRQPHTAVNNGSARFSAPQTSEKELSDPESLCRISVIIAWVNSFDLLTAGMDALAENSRPADEIVVVTRRSAEDRRRFQKKYPHAILIGASRDAPITELRCIGIRCSTGSVVVITEDHCVPSKNWLAIVEQRIKEGSDVVGGPVENAWDDRLRDEAAFLTEYAFAIRSKNEKENDSSGSTIPGNNVAYRRELAEGLCETLDKNLWESFYCDKLRAEGKKLFYDPKMLLFHRRPFDFFYFAGQRFHFCRSFAEMRSQSLDKVGRAKYGAGSALLPPVLWLRGMRILMKKRRMVGRYFLCSPLIWVYLCAGAIGEMIGYFFGGGKSLARVE